MKESANTNDNPFSLSIGDLMAALLLIFVLLLAATLLRIEEEDKNRRTIAEDYYKTREELIEALKNEFKEDFKSWGATLIEEELLIRFNQEDIEKHDGPKFFWRESGEYELNLDHKEILSNFFPRYVRVLTDQRFRNDILEVRIEGHTDTTWRDLKEDSYLKNMELSQDRTRSVLNFSLSTINNSITKAWCQDKITANGLSYSRLLNKKDPSSPENRRVEFRIITNAEKQIDKILQLGKSQQK